MPEMSEKYVDVLLQVSGKNLDAKIINPLLIQYDDLLKDCKISEERSDGKIFKASVNVVDDRQHELLDKNTLILSRKVKFNIHNPLPHSMNNAEHYIYVKLHRALMEITVKLDTPEGEIVVRTRDTHVFGNSRNKRWPMSEVDRAFL